MFQQMMIIGYLGSDPEMRYTQSGVAVTGFSVATTEKWTGADGEKHEDTTWFRVSAWGKLADLTHQYLKKGRLVMVQGTVKTSAFSKQDGTPGASLELRAQVVKFLPDGKNHDRQEEEYNF